jgi:vacuolar-type H+-ATPase subunit D/Vma8
MREREIIPELRENIESIKSRLEGEKEIWTLERAKLDLEKSDMPYLNFDRSVLEECCLEMFERLSLIARFKISKENFKNLVKDVSKHMKIVPYHNFTHVFNIVHVCYIMIRTSTAR